MPHAVLSTLYFMAFSHALLLTVILWRRAPSGSPARLLAIAMALLAYKLLEGGAVHSQLYRYMPHLLDLLPNMVMVLGPVLYAYVRRMTGQRAFTAGNWVLHLLPAFAVWLLSAPDVFRSGDAKIAMWAALQQDQAPGGISMLLTIKLVAMKVHLASYLALAWRRLDAFAPALDQLRADNSRNVLQRLRQLMIAFILLEALWVGLFLVQQTTGLITLGTVGQAWLLFLSAIVVLIALQGLQKPDFLITEEERALTGAPAPPAEDPAAPETEAGATIKYLHSALPDTAAAEVAALIEQRLEEDALYLDESLSLTKLAKAIGHKSHTVSQVINQHMKSNFYRLINSYRIQYALTLIEDPKRHWSLERIAIESGFTNRVTFNKAFKEQLDCTPSQYRAERRATSGQA